MTTPPGGFCNCCPTTVQRCLQQVSPLVCNPATITPLTPFQHTPTGATVVADPNGFVHEASRLPRTYDGSPAADLGNFVLATSGAAQTATGTVLEWTYTTPLDEVWSFSLWHGAGNVLSDCDGIVSATLEVFAGASLLFSGPIVSGNSGIEWVTPFGARLDGVTRFRLSNMSKCAGAPNMYIREVALNTPWRATIQQSCPPVTMVGVIEAVNDTSQPGLTLSGGNLTQTNGPHTIAWSVPSGVTGTIVTNQPGNFSSLSVVDGTTTTVSGNTTQTFSITWDSADPSSLRAPAYLMLCHCDPDSDVQVVQPTSFTNGSFEQPVTGTGAVNNADVPGWDQVDGTYLEVWHTPFNAGTPGLVPYPNGSQQLVEIQGAVGPNEVAQVVTVPAVAGTVHWGFWLHRREGVTGEVTTLQLGDDATPASGHEVVVTAPIAVGDNAWHEYSGTWSKPAGVTAVRMTFTTNNTSGAGAGGLLDEVTFTMTSACTPGTDAPYWVDANGDQVDPSLITDC